MPLSVDTNFGMYEIAEITALAPGHPVYMLHGLHNDKLVVKGENGARDALRFNTKLMSAIDPNVKMKPLAQVELSAIRFYAQQHMVDPAMAPLMAALAQTTLTWVKIKALNIKSLDNVGDIVVIRRFAEALTTAGGMERLGEIVAADLFNGNDDRFWPYGGGIGLADGRRTRCLYNTGNVFITLEHGQSRISGLDSFRDGSETELSKPLVTTGEPWPGVMLRPEQKPARMAFAQNIVDDLNMILGPRHRTLNFGKRLPSNARDRLVAGMESGVEKIRLRITRTKMTWSQGVADRFRAMNWRLP